MAVIRTIAIIVTAFGTTGTAAFAQTPDSCEKLKSLTLPNTAITMAQSVATGEFNPNPGRGATPAALRWPRAGRREQPGRSSHPHQSG